MYQAIVSNTFFKLTRDPKKWRKLSVFSCPQYRSLGSTGLMEPRLSGHGKHISGRHESQIILQSKFKPIRILVMARNDSKAGD